MNQKNHTTTKRPIADLVTLFLALDATDLKVNRRGPAKSTTLKIDESGITYTFSKCEVETLKLFHELTGAPLDWLAKDAIGWARGYMADLVTRGTGQLEDLIDIDDGGPCPVRGKKMKARTRKFIKAIKREWDRRLAFGRRRALLAAFEVRRQWAVSRMAA